MSLLGYDGNIYPLLAGSVPMATRDEFVEGINDRLEDVELYELAEKEIEQGGVAQGLWVKPWQKQRIIKRKPKHFTQNYEHRCSGIREM